jgi:cytochrome c biogenesis protein CcmG, thiol:disulfide interchange protein DsbE
VIQALLLSFLLNFPVYQDTTLQPAPSFALKDLRGKTVRLEDYRGKIVLLNFWATWCAPCQTEMPDLMNLQKQYADKGLQILGITYEKEPAAKITRITRKFKLTYPVLLGAKSLSDSYGIEEALPVTVIVDREGKIRDRIIGMMEPEEIKEKILPLLEK